MKDTKRKIKEAAALRYNMQENNAPEIVAVGKGEIAERLINIAKDSDIPIYEDEALAHILSGFELGIEIPPELYGAVAEILVFVGNLDKNFGEKNAKR